MNTMRCRMGMLGMIALSAAAHAAAAYGVPNTPEGMFAFHLFAALLDVFLFLMAPELVQGQLRRDTQLLILAGVAGNVAGWVLYMAYVSPVYFDTYMWLVTAAQAIRLFYVARRDEEQPGVVVPHFLERAR